MLHADPLGTLDEMNTREKAAGGEDTAAGASPLWIDTDDWNEADIPRRPWVAPGYALRGAVTLVCGPPSALKSSTMLAWGAAIALNREWGAFHPTAAGKVIIYNVEDDMQEQRRRISAVLRHLGAKPLDLKDKVFRVGPHSIGTLLERGEDGKIQFTPAMQTLVDLVAAWRPAALIVDPLAELHDVEENDNTALRAIIARFRALAVKYNMAVIILHHTRKGSATSPGDPDIARGASAIIGAVRIAVTLTTMSEADAQAFGLPTDVAARNNYVRMDDAKSNYAPLRAAQWFEKVPYTLENGEVVPAAVPWTPPEAKIASATDLAALKAAIERGCPTGEPWSAKLSSEPRSVRPLLERHGFNGCEAQKGAMGKLSAECGLVTAQYRNPRNRTQVSGLRIGAKPAAAWVDPVDDPKEEATE